MYNFGGTHQTYKKREFKRIRVHVDAPILGHLISELKGLMNMVAGN